MSPTILVLGGYGQFGGRLVRILAGEPGLTVMVAGRSRQKAEDFCRSLGNVPAEIQAVAVERDDIAAVLPGLGADIVVDATGPFQTYGDRPYRVAEACLACGVDYIDLADGRDFVAGIGAFEEAAQAAGRIVISGASTCPALSMAVARDLAQPFAHVRRIRLGIAPSPFAGIGLSVVKAICAYAGQRLGPGWALIDTVPITVAPPGVKPLRRLRFHLVDVPDLALMPRDWPEAEICAGAATQPQVLQRCLSLFAWPVRLGILRDLVPWAGLFHAASRRLRWGEHRGGMIVEVEGDLPDGRRGQQSWHLVAEGDAGPNIPVMAAAIILLDWAAGRKPSPGARHAGQALSLKQFDPLFDRFGIRRGQRGTEAGASVFRELLGPVWQDLPPALRDGHSAPTALAGRADVERGPGWLAGLVARIFALPPAGRDMPVHVAMTVEGDEEIWHRRFGAHGFMSRLSAGRGWARHLLVERFGPITFAMALEWDGTKLRWTMRDWRLVGLPMPRWLLPKGDVFETVEEGRFRFDVAISLPVMGLIVRYRGWLALENSA